MPDDPLPSKMKEVAAITNQVIKDLLVNQEFVKLLESAISTAMEKKLGDILTSFESLQGAVFDLNSCLEKKNEEIKRLESKVCEQENRIQKMESTMNNMEQYSRRSCIRIFGVPEQKGEDTDQLAVRIIESKLGVNLDPVKDIDRSHRTGKVTEASSRQSQPSSRASRSVDSAKPRPIIVKLTTYRKRREIIMNRKKLKGSGIVIVEDLTAANQKLLTAARKSKNFKAVWSSDGRVIALVGSTGGKDIKKVITSESDIK